MKLSHDGLEKFVQEVLCKREPCPAMVLAWGWMLKQGEGGIFHNDTYKQRYFVLARVPHATVLIYYGQKCMDEDHILGYIDLRRVTTVRETTKMVALDQNKSTTNTLMTKLKGLVGSAPPPEGFPRPVLELVTSGRVFVLSPATIIMPPPMTTSMSLGPSATGKPLYLFGWPFPVPPLDEEDDEKEVNDLVAEGKYSTDAFAQWRDVMATAVAAEKATRVFPVMTLVDSSAQLPQRVLLRTTPCELAVISVDDKDCSFTAIPYNDLLKWEVQVDTELHLTARTRSRLVARPDRTGFTSQRPTRASCHYVFNSAAAKAIVGVVDGHLRALAKQLGSDGAGGGGDDDGGDGAEDEYAAAAARATPTDPGYGGGGFDAEEDTPSAGKHLAGRRPAPRAAAGRDQGDDEEDESGGAGHSSSRSNGARAGAGGSSSRGAAQPQAAAKQPVKKAAPAAHDSEEEDDDEADRKAAAAAAAKKKATAAAAAKAKAAAAAAAAAAEDDDEDERPSSSSRGSKKGVGSSSSSKKHAAPASEDEEEDEAPKRSSSSKSGGSSGSGGGGKKSSKKAVSDEEEEEEAAPRKSSASKKAAASSSSSSSSRRKTSSASEEEAPAKSKKKPAKKAPSDDDDSS